MCTPHDSSDKPDTRQTQQKTTSRYWSVISIRFFGKERVTLTLNLNTTYCQIVFPFFLILRDYKKYIVTLH